MLIDRKLITTHSYLQRHCHRTVCYLVRPEESSTGNQLIEYTDENLGLVKSRFAY